MIPVEKVFSIEPGEPFSGRLLYIQSEYSFYYTSPQMSEPAGSFSSLIIADTLQLQVALPSGLLLGSEGYFPYFHWRLDRVSPPLLTVPGRLRYSNSEALLPGVGHDLWRRSSKYLMKFDPLTGWFLISAPSLRLDDADARVQHIEIVSGLIVASVDHNGQLVGLWMRPEWVYSLQGLQEL